MSQLSGSRPQFPFIHVCLAVSIFSLLTQSCGNRNLSKETAKVLIDSQLAQYPYVVEIISNHKYYPNEEYGAMMVANIHKLADSGYLNCWTLSATGEGYDQCVTFGINLKDKIRPFIANIAAYPDMMLYKLTAGKPVAEITSINEPAPDGSGNMVCNVHFRMRPDLNAFGNVIQYAEDKYKNYVKSPEKTAKFVKTETGWQLESIDEMYRR